MAKAQKHADEHEAEAFRTGTHAGRAKSWLAVTVMLLGFIIGGVGLTLGPNWFLFWTGGVVIVLGGILAMVFDIFSDVIVDARRSGLPAAEHHSPFEHRRSAGSA